MEKTRSQMLAIPADGGDIERPQILVERLLEAEGFRVESAEPEDNVVQITVVCGEESLSVEIVVPLSAFFSGYRFRSDTEDRVRACGGDGVW